MRTSIGGDDLCIKVYNPKDKKLIAVYDSYKRAGLKLGVSPELVQRRVATKKRLYSPTFDLEVAIRLGVRSKDIEELIKKR